MLPFYTAMIKLTIFILTPSSDVVALPGHLLRPAAEKMSTTTMGGVLCLDPPLKRIQIKRLVCEITVPDPWRNRVVRFETKRPMSGAAKDVQCRSSQ